MNIMIVGAGEIGRHLATNLSTQAHNITVFEMDETNARELDSRIDARVISGDGSAPGLLVENGVGECNLFLALTSSDNDNLVACSVAKALGAAKTIARVKPDLQRDEFLFDHRAHFGVDHLFSSERLAAVELSKFIRNPDALFVEEIARGRIELQLVAVDEDAQASGKTLASIGLDPRVRIGRIERDGEYIIPGAGDTVEGGDTIALFGEPAKISEAIDKFSSSHTSHSDEGRRVVIFGGGEYGFTLAQMLDAWNFKVRIFDRDPAVCEDLTHRLSRTTTVINADATSLTELREEQVDAADFFVATTQGDEDNVMTCLQAHNLGTTHCLTLIHRSDYADAISTSGLKFGIMAAVSPREATRQELMRFVTSDRYHLVRRLEGAEVIEASIAKDSPLIGKKVSEVKWPTGCVLIALLNGAHASVPAAEDTFAAENNLYAMVSDKAKRKFLALL